MQRIKGGVSEPLRGSESCGLQRGFIVEASEKALNGRRVVRGDEPQPLARVQSASLALGRFGVGRQMLAGVPNSDGPAVKRQKPLVVLDHSVSFVRSAWLA